MPITNKLQSFRQNVSVPEINHNLCFYFAGWQPRKENLKKKRHSYKAHYTLPIYYILFYLTASTNKMVIKETSF